MVRIHPSLPYGHIVELAKTPPFHGGELGFESQYDHHLWAPRPEVRIGDCLSPDIGSIPMGLARIALNFFGTTGIQVGLRADLYGTII